MGVRRVLALVLTTVGRVEVRHMYDGEESMEDACGGKEEGLAEAEKVDGVGGRCSGSARGRLPDISVYGRQYY